MQCSAGINLTDAHRRDLLQVLLRWGLQSDCIIIPKSVTPSRIEEWGHGRLVDFELDSQAMSALNGLEDGTKYCWDPTDVA